MYYLQIYIQFCTEIMLLNAFNKIYFEQGLSVKESKKKNNNNNFTLDFITQKKKKSSNLQEKKFEVHMMLQFIGHAE